MGLFGSLFTGVSALGAQSQATAIISNNIANVNTTGFKRSEAAFESLVTSQGRSTLYSPGTVTASRIQRVNLQGAISQSASSTDAAISGNGMFAIKRDNLDSALTQFLYTRNGQFSEDAQGYMRNSAGFYLYGWPLDTQGNLPANQGDLDSLVPVDVAFLGGLTRPTENAEISINLDAREVDELQANALTSEADFQRGLTVYDSLGNPQPVTFEYVKTYGPMGTAVTNGGGYLASDNLLEEGLAEGDQFTVDSENFSFTYEVDSDGVIDGGGAPTLVQTIGEIITAINTDFAGASTPAEVQAYLGNDGEIIIQRTEYGQTLTQLVNIDDSAGTALSDLGFDATVIGFDQFSSDLQETDAGGNLIYSNGAVGDADGDFSGGEFPAFRNVFGDPDYNPRGWWQLTIRDPVDNVISRGLLSFNDDGSINGLPDTDGNVDIELGRFGGIDWGNGSDLQSFNIDVERLSQFASDYTVLFSDQDGAELGLRTAIEIDREGFVIARFSNGATSNLYKLPLVTFANENGLEEVSGTAYSETEESGEENLREAGRSGAGFVEPSALEGSNVDLADEFAKLIVSQRAFSAGTKVINTVDQMTEELLRLR